VPLPTSLPPVGSPAGSRRSAPRTLPFLVAAVLLGASAFALPVPAAAVALALGTLALAGAAAQAMRRQWAAAARNTAPSTVAVAAPGAVPADVLTLRLRRLHELHAEKVNQAIDEGREDLARELSDAYADQALRAITAAGV
jgi:hypothetical protein